jgi:hypothetical protein
MGTTHDDWNVEGDISVKGQLLNDAGDPVDCGDGIEVKDRVTAGQVTIYVSNGSVLSEVVS